MTIHVRCAICGESISCDGRCGCPDEPYHPIVNPEIPSSETAGKEIAVKTPVFILDADDDMGSHAIGTAASRAVAEANLLGEIQVVLDTLEGGDDGDRVTLVLTRLDMTPEELDALPEE
jgi:hypothetical protein